MRAETKYYDIYGDVSLKYSEIMKLYLTYNKIIYSAFMKVLTPKLSIGRNKRE